MDTVDLVAAVIEFSVWENENKICGHILPFVDVFIFVFSARLVFTPYN